MSNRSGQRAPTVEPGDNPQDIPGAVPVPPETFTQLLETMPPASGAARPMPGTPYQTSPEAEQAPVSEINPLAGLDLSDPAALAEEIRRLHGVHLSDDPRDDLAMPRTVVFPGNPREVMQQAETIARQNDPFRTHAQVALGESIIHVHDTVQPVIAAASTPDKRRSLNDMAEVSDIARQLMAQPKFTVILPNNAADNKQYDHPVCINGFIIYVLTGVPSLVPESVYLILVTAGLIHPQRKKDYQLCPTVSALAQAAQIVQPHVGGGIMGAGLSREQ